jgi:hypothetical protein
MNRLYRGYVGLLNAPLNAQGWRTVPLERFGVFEVRLVEFDNSRKTDTADIWIELYRHDTQASLDSCRCQDLDEAEDFAAHLIGRARQLSGPQSDSEPS